MAGIPTLRFSFSGNGDSEGRFEDSCVSKEVEDLGAVIDSVKAQGRRIAYVGHSMGGAVGVKRAAADDRIELLVSLAGMVHTAKFAKVEFGEETPGSGFMWGKKDCPLSLAFVDDMNQIGSVLDLGAQIKLWLLVHGTVDDVVSIAESREILPKLRIPKSSSKSKTATTSSTPKPTRNPSGHGPKSDRMAVAEDDDLKASRISKPSLKQIIMGVFNNSKIGMSYACIDATLVVSLRKLRKT